jgi:hypothetical protein
LFSMGRLVGFTRVGMSAVSMFLRVRNAIYKKYSNYEQAVRAFQAAMRDGHPSHEAAPSLSRLNGRLVRLNTV